MELTRELMLALIGALWLLGFTIHATLVLLASRSAHKARESRRRQLDALRARVPGREMR